MDQAGVFRPIQDFQGFRLADGSSHPPFDNKRGAGSKLKADIIGLAAMAGLIDEFCLVPAIAGAHRQRCAPWRGP